MNVKYKRKIWKVLCPKNLGFPPNTIRNVLIERGNKQIITNINKLTVINSNFKELTTFFLTGL